MPIASAVKRPGDASEGALVPVKKPRGDVAIIPGTTGPVRTSGLMAPIMLLTGHDGEIYASKFSNEGSVIASAGFERKIYLWQVYGECENIAVLSGHSGAIVDLSYSTDNSTLFTASTDKTVGLWDLATGQRIKRHKGHQMFVNCCHPARRGPQLVCSGSDDGTVKLWDSRRRGAQHTFQNSYQVTSISFNDTAEQIFSGGIDNIIKVWDLRKEEVLYELKGHTDTVTGLELSPDGSYILSNSMDNTLRVWDIRPFAPQERCVKIFQGHQHNFEKNLLRCAWSPDGSKVSAGSADQHVYVWDTTSRRVLYKLPGHNGAVNETDFHPVEPIVLSASTDKKIYLGEIEP